MSTARILASQAIRSVATLEQSMGDFVYGAAGISPWLQIGLNLSSNVLSTLPLFSILFATTDILKALEESWYAPKGTSKTANAGLHVKSLIRIATSEILGVIGYETLHQAMIWGSASFCLMCYGFFIKAAGDFFISFYDFIQASSTFEKAQQEFQFNTNRDNIKINPVHLRQYAEANEKLWLNALNFLGWALLALATAMASSTLLLIGNVFLVLAGLYAMKRVYTAYQDKLNPINGNNNNLSRIGALQHCLFSTPAYGIRSGETTCQTELPLFLPKNA